MADIPENISQHNISADHGEYEDFILNTEMKVIFILLGLMALLIVLLNSLVFVLAWQMKYLQTKTNFFLLSLAASDLLSGVLVLPLVMSCNIVLHNESTCIVMDICQRGLAISTILHLSSAVMERYLKISSPFKYTSIVTKPRIAAVLTAVWTSAMTVSLAQLLIITSEDILEAHLIYNTTILSLFVFVPFLVTLVAFIGIFIIIKHSKESRMTMTCVRHRNALQKKKQKNNVKRSLIVYLVMLICFVLAWFPYFFLTLLIDLDKSLIMRIPQWVNVLLLFLKISSALFNPCLFTFFKADFQKALRQMSSRTMAGISSISSRTVGRESTGKTGSYRTTQQTHVHDKLFELKLTKHDIMMKYMMT